MSLKYEEIQKFARENGNIRGWAEKGTVTLLKSGDIDSIIFWEEEAVRFDHAGVSYSREQFERFIRSSGTAARLKWKSMPFIQV